MPGMSPWLASSLRPHGEAVVLKGEGLLQQTVPEHSGLADTPRVFLDICEGTSAQYFGPAWLGCQVFLRLALPKSALAHQVFGPEIGAATTLCLCVLTGGLFLLSFGHQVF